MKRINPLLATMFALQPDGVTRREWHSIARNGKPFGDGYDGERKNRAILKRRKRAAMLARTWTGVR